MYGFPVIEDEGILVYLTVQRVEITHIVNPCDYRIKKYNYNFKITEIYFNGFKELNT